MHAEPMTVPPNGTLSPTVTDTQTPTHSRAHRHLPTHAHPDTYPLTRTQTPTHSRTHRHLPTHAHAPRSGLVSWPYVQETLSLYGFATYEEYVDTFIATVKPDILSYDCYPEYNQSQVRTCSPCQNGAKKKITHVSNPDSTIKRFNPI